MAKSKQKISIFVITSSFFLLLTSLPSSSTAGTANDRRRQIWVETQNVDDPANTLDIIYYSDRTCEISYRAAGRSQPGWVCDNSTQQGGGCIYRTYLCDGVVNCQNGQDEDAAFCTTRQCEADKGENFRCPSGRCLPSVSRCNSRPDCPIAYSEDSKYSNDLAYDELFCPCTITSAVGKRRDGYWCRTAVAEHSRQCIAKTAWCDGREDCDDGEDENPIVCSAKDQILAGAVTNHQAITTTTVRPTTTTKTAKHRPPMTTTKRPLLETILMTTSDRRIVRLTTTGQLTTTLPFIRPLQTTTTHEQRRVPTATTASRPFSTTIKHQETAAAATSTKTSSVLPASTFTSTTTTTTAATTTTTSRTTTTTTEEETSTVKMTTTDNPYEAFSLNLDGAMTTQSAYYDDDDETTKPPYSPRLVESSSSEEVTQSLDHPGGSARQQDEDMVVYIAIGTIAAAVFVGGLIFLVILNVRRSAAMASRKDKHIGRGYSTIPTSAIFSKQPTLDNKQPPPVNGNNSLQRPPGQNEKQSSSSNHDDPKTDQTDMAVRQPLLGPADSNNSDALATTSKV